MNGAGSMSKKRILAVDDSKSLRQMVNYTLRGAGYDVAEAEDGEAALDLAKRERFSLVLTDQNMPKMTGLPLIKTLRALAEYKTVPILVLTTESSAEMKTQGRAAGATGWI